MKYVNYDQMTEKPDDRERRGNRETEESQVTVCAPLREKLEVVR